MSAGQLIEVRFPREAEPTAEPAEPRPDVVAEDDDYYDDDPIIGREYIIGQQVPEGYKVMRGVTGALYLTRKEPAYETTLPGRIEALEEQVRTLKRRVRAAERHMAGAS